ncbi:MAG TPA: DUF1972 domain-containing protein [Aquaticitalea sp.]|nr:DUF1972 domain-containing protein [Aquaticitalea sp.]
MKIAILGTRGIPNNHGGFEQFAEYFSVFLARKGHEVFVYNSHNHPYREKNYNGVGILRCFDPEYRIGTAGQFIYDFNCILDSRNRDFDIILQLGYTSSSIWHRLMPKGATVITNMDGMEWKRSKYSKAVRKFLKYAEKLAVKHSDFLISDSKGIQEYIKTKYRKDSEYIAYGATLFDRPNPKILQEYRVSEYGYCLLIARLEPENNIETILKGYDAASTDNDLIIFGSINDYGKMLQNKFRHNRRIRFMGANYNLEHLNNLRYYSRYYFHGHSVGGTNPSLLEAMASNALIVAHGNVFNKSILGDQAVYFENSTDIEAVLKEDTAFCNKETFTKLNAKKIELFYTWDAINASYETYILNCIKERA